MSDGACERRRMKAHFRMTRSLLVPSEKTRREKMKFGLSAGMTLSEGRLERATNRRSSTAYACLNLMLSRKEENKQYQQRQQT